MKPIFVGFSRPKKFMPLAWLIMKIEDTEYSHVYLKFYSASMERWLIYEAGGLMVRFKGSTLFQMDNLCVDEFKIELDDAHYNKTIAWCVDNCGRPYGIFQLFGMLYSYIIKHIFNEDVKNPLRDGRKSQVCSEMIGYLLKDNGIINIEEDLDLAGPKKIYNIVEKFTTRK